MVKGRGRKQNKRERKILYNYNNYALWLDCENNNSTCTHVLVY